MTQLDQRAPAASLELRVGDVVEVKSAEEILATLDENGELENLPFMPEMLRFCGQRLTVHKVAHKLCDALTWTGMHKMTRAVHLTGARCDGSAHGGCQTACSLYWKEDWLRRLEPDEVIGGSPSQENSPTAQGGTRLSLPILEVNARRGTFEDGATRYTCQATEILRAAPERLPVKDLSHFVDDVRLGNAGTFFVVRAVFVAAFNRLQSLSRSWMPERLRFRRGLPWRFLAGTAGHPTPTEVLDLQPGEVVRVKSREEIIATLDENLLNRGMGFDAEMSRYCGRTAVVQARVDRCLDERTGRLMTMKNPCIILERTVCSGAYSSVCPREYVPFWREIWLERV
jgi:hypothetical protein